MNDSKISVRYSKALFESAIEKKLLDKVYQDMILISKICSVEEVKEILRNPVIRPTKKKAILSGVLGKNVEKITLSMVDLLISNGRENFLPAMARVFRTETLKYRGITETSLITAVPVNEATKKKVIDLIENVFKTRVELKESVNKEIIGGFILKINDSYIDASIKNKLRMVRKGLAAGAGIKEI
jgi:F-type H+-transporting ATPase subunit delta